TVAHEGGRDTHTVEHIPDIVQHARGHVRHAGAAGSVHQLPVELVELLGIQLVLGDVMENAAHGHGLALLNQHHAALPNPDRPAIGGDHAVFKTVRFAPRRHFVAGG